MSSEILILDTKANDFKKKFNLSGFDFTFRFKWITRNGEKGLWMVDLYDSNDNPLVIGMNAVINYSLFSLYDDPALPFGRVYLVDMSETKEEIGRFDLGNRVKMFYSDEGL